ncbi:MAG TPA: trypco2 family protein [Solirubrobacterales bacterium]
MVSKVREELEALDASRRVAGKPALFVVEELELELQFTAIKRGEGHGGIDLKVITLGGSKGVESGAVQKINLRFALDEKARRRNVRGTRGHSSERDEETSEDTETL